ncbi:A24 family peptidase [uncultured Limosilactobacillus sp.]|uniref:prepilin peptidase n=1 Tax=uncultured Limosilactobacillus sp. TaxID=2837629 RepID=UPI0025E8CA3C|nr:A24 family peptidase [uncultured Limosilactobacillus sp.]
MSIVLFLTGACWCSFLTTMTWRKLFFRSCSFNQRSVCDHCKQIIRWYHLIPIIGYVIQKGKCKQCGKPINRFWITTEILSAFLWMEFPIFSISDAIIFILVDSCMLITCTEDWFTQKFNGAWLISIGFLHWLTIMEPFQILTIGYVVIWSVCYWYRKIGNGDVDFILLAILSCGATVANQMIFLACFFSLFHPKLFHKVAIPFLPFLWCGLFLSLIIKKHALV